eukprot:m.14935 g.14935  ORF g.14935 m.14935 type:complete len:52 (+) comp8493_c0_seq1:897-1052(+)
MPPLLWRAGGVAAKRGGVEGVRLRRRSWEAGVLSRWCSAVLCGLREWLVAR